jgi:hypothetical protein
MPNQQRADATRTCLSAYESKDRQAIVLSGAHVGSN